MKYLWFIFIATGIGYFVNGSYGALIGLGASLLLSLLAFMVDAGKGAGLKGHESIGYTLLILLVIGAGVYGYTQDGILGALAGLVTAFIVLSLVRPANFKKTESGSQ